MQTWEYKLRKLVVATHSVRMALLVYQEMALQPLPDNLILTTIGEEAREWKQSWAEEGGGAHRT